MELQDYLSILRARWALVVGTVLIAVAAAAVFSIRATPIYVARSNVFFSVTVGGSASELSRGFTYAQGLVRSYSKVATQPVVLDPVIAQLGLDLTPAQLSRKVTAQAPLDTVIIEIRVADPSPVQAAAIANAVSESLIRTVGRLAPQSGDGGSAPVKVTTVSAAGPPVAATSPRTTLNLLLALVVGTLGGGVLALARNALDARVDSRREVARVTQAPVLGTVTGSTDEGLSGLYRFGLYRFGLFRFGLFRRRRKPTPEQTKQLRTNFQHLRSERSLRSVVFTSAIEGGATSLTVSDLAISLSEAGVHLLLVDADLRRPTLAARHGGNDELGLSSVLSGHVDWRAVVTRSSAGVPVSLLSAGPPLNDPSAMLNPVALGGLITELLSEFDLVLVKAPPVLRVAEGLLIARLADGVVVVINENSMNRNALAEEVDALELAGADLLGVVLKV